MSAEFGSRGSEGVRAGEWLLRSEGMRVEGPDGLVGHVVAPLYGPSVRWDSPRGFAVRTSEGIVQVPWGAIERVDAAARRLELRPPHST